MNIIRSLLLIIATVLTALAFFMLHYFIIPGFEGTFYDRIYRHPFIAVMGFLMVAIAIAMGFLVQWIEETERRTGKISSSTTGRW